MTVDEHSGSRRSDVWAELKAENDQSAKVSKAATDLALWKDHLDDAERELKRLFGKVEDCRVVLEGGGVMAHLMFGPILGAAHGAWLRDRDVPRRLELTELSEAPIPPEEER